MIKMNKIFRNILLLAVVSVSFASCSQVDMFSETEIEEQKQSTTITLNMHSAWQGTPVVFATNTMGAYNRVFYYNDQKLNDDRSGYYHLRYSSTNGVEYVPNVKR